ncbi:hypothetical protein [Altererythrobacter sp. MF3-039]|uniref:hypothetical protein n=1 Tax=Altererythrobacter sp. MF3-039 TaxID=3252901 RepID=UPI00390C7072
MAATQAPKGFAILFVLVGVPLIMWDAWSTSGEINKNRSSANAAEARQARCVSKMNVADIPQEMRAELCRCVANEAKARGLSPRPEGYDAQTLEPMVEDCWNLLASKYG